jgi:uncharacterized BrkB/YihY/UPF0761 family membrane protein
MLSALIIVIGFIAAWKGLPFLYRRFGKPYAWAAMGAIVVMTLVSAALGIAACILLGGCALAEIHYQRMERIKPPDGH